MDFDSVQVWPVRILDHAAVVSAPITPFPEKATGSAFDYTAPDCDQEALEKFSQKVTSELRSDSVAKILTSPDVQVSCLLHANGAFQWHAKQGSARQEGTWSEPDEKLAGLFATRHRQRQVAHGIGLLQKASTRWKNRRKEVGRARRGVLKPCQDPHDHWYQRFHEVSRALQNASLSQETRRRLTAFAIQYLAKVANLSQKEAQKIHFDTTPLQGSSAWYQRECYRMKFLPMLKALNECNCEQMGWTGELLSIDDADRFMEFLKHRRWKLCHLRYDDDDQTLRRKISAAHGLDPSSIDAWLRSTIGWLGQISWLRPLGQRLGLALSNDVVYVYELPQLPCTKEAVLDYHSQQVALERRIHRCLDTFMTSGSLLGIVKNGKDETMFTAGLAIDCCQRMASIGGFTPTLQQTAERLSRQVSLKGVPELFRLEGDHEAPPRLGSLVSRDFAEFLSSATMKAFRSFAKTSPSVSARLLAQGIDHFIGGIQPLSVDEAFRREQITPLLQASYARVLNAMERIMAIDFKKDNQADLYLDDAKNLLMEELFLWLDFAVEENINEDLLGLLRQEVVPQAPLKPTVVGLCSCGMRAVTAISEVCESVVQTHGRAISIINFEDTYFEVSEQQGSKQTMSPYDEQDFGKNLAFVDKGSVDMLWVDFHGSYAYDAVRSHDVTSLVRQTLESGAAAKPLTVVCDLTLGRIDDPEAAELIRTFEKEILQGELNVVFYNTIQKLDQFGADKLSGGWVQVYSGHQETVEAFRRRLETEMDHVDLRSKKGLLHLYRFCRQDLDHYRLRLWENAAFLYSRIERALKEGCQIYGVGFATKADAQNHLLGFCHNWPNRNFDTQFIEKLEERGFTLPTRLSHGFPYTSLCPVDQYTSRLSVGLEDRERLELFASVFNECADYRNKR